MSVPCGRTSLKGHPCVKPANHEGNHRRFDGKEWPEGQSWRDVVGEYFASQGITADEATTDAFIKHVEFEAVVNPDGKDGYE